METVQIREVIDTGRKTGTGDPILTVYLLDGREGTAFDGRFLDLDVLDTHELEVRDKGMFRGKPDIVFNLPKNYKAPQMFPGNSGPFPDLIDNVRKEPVGFEGDILDVKQRQQQDQTKKVILETISAPSIEIPDAPQHIHLPASPEKRPLTWSDALSQAQTSISAIMTGRETEARIEAGFAQQAMEEDPKLKSCDPMSILNAVTQIARTGMTLNPALQLAHLIPRHKNGKLICCLEFTYRGYTKILKDYGCVRDIQAVIVYKDEQYEEGISQIDKPIHKRNYPDSEEQENKRQILGVYCRVILPGDNATIYTQLTPNWKILKAMNMSPGKDKNGSAWKNWKQEMYLKTKLKFDFKTLIAGAPDNRALQAIEIEHQNEQFTPAEDISTKNMEADVFGETQKPDEGMSFTDEFSVAQTIPEDFQATESHKTRSTTSIPKSGIKRKTARGSRK